MANRIEQSIFANASSSHFNDMVSLRCMVLALLNYRGGICAKEPPLGARSASKAPPGPQLVARGQLAGGSSDGLSSTGPG
jgi:hypothetical protein